MYRSAKASDGKSVQAAFGGVGLILFFFFILLSAPWGAHAAYNQQRSAEALTQQLIGLSTAYDHASPTARSKALEDLVAAATKRRDLLAGLIDSDPELVLRVALPAAVRTRMPVEVQSYMEQHVELGGELEVIYKDYPDGTASLHHFLNANGKRVALHFKTVPPGLLTGTTVSATGVLLDDAMALESGEQILTLAADGGSDGGSNGGTPAPVPNTLGEQRTLVMLVNFQDDPREPFTVEEARSFVFGEASDFFYENSYGQTWLAGDVYGWYTLPTTTTCSDTVIREEADAMASVSGVSLSDYDRIVYIYPNDSCGLGGQSTVGGSPSRAYVYVFPDLRIFDHELGHSLGLHHSHGMNCTGAVIGSDCDEVEYGDRLDIMGGRELHFNAFQKERLGWLDYGDSPPIATVQTDETFRLAPYEENSTGLHALKIFRDLDPVSGQPRYYYLEYRPLLGFDAVLQQDPYANIENIVNGVVFHLGTVGDGLHAENSSFLLDMTPDTSTSLVLDLDDPALISGQSYSDPIAGVTISTDWTDETGATVSVSFDQATCTRSNPQVVISPSQSQWASPGTAVDYEVTLINADNAACPSATFDLSAVVPSGWTAVFDDPALTLPPETSGSTHLVLRSPVTASDNFYYVAVNAENSADPSYVNSATATYVVNTPTTNGAPVAIDDDATLTQVQPIVINVLSNDSDPDNDTILVNDFTQGAKGTVDLNNDGTLTYTPGSRFKNRDSFTYSISDGVTTGTAMVTISLLKKANGNSAK